MQTTKIALGLGTGAGIDPRDALHTTEYFTGNSRHDLYRKMNKRLFELEGEGHELVEQVEIVPALGKFAEKRNENKLKKTKKKLNRLKKQLNYE